MELSALWIELLGSDIFHWGVRIVSVLVAMAGVLKFFHYLQMIGRSRAARRLEKKLAKTKGAPSYTEADIANACRNYVEPFCTQIDPSDEDDLRNVIALAPLFKTIDDHLALGGEKKHVILLADSGMGKTSFCINYYATEQKKKKASRQNIAIVPLGLGGALGQIAQLQNQNETIIFLDAFDEDPEAITNPHERLNVLMKAASNFKNVILTCRSQFFSNDDDIPRGSGIMYAAPRRAGVPRELPLHKLFLAPLTKDQIGKFLARHFPYTSIGNVARRKRAARLVDAIPELSVRPMLLELLPDLIREKREIVQLYGLYQYLVANWLKREKEWIEERDLYEISIELAVSIFIQQRQGLGDRVSAEFLDSLASQHDRPLETWRLKSRSLLNRDIQGSYKFAHRSIMEYLVLVAAVNGDSRAMSVEWTDLMKDLLVSLANSSAEGERLTLELLNKDLMATHLLPIATPLASPRRLSSAEAKRIMRRHDISRRQNRRIPPAWRNSQLEVARQMVTPTLCSYLIRDRTHGISWVVNDTSKLQDNSERKLYLDTYGATTSYTVIQPHQQRISESYRLPSLEELIALWDSEPYLQKTHNVGHVFDPNSVYWVGDRLEDKYLCCSFGIAPNDLPELRLIETRQVDGNRMHLYELIGRYSVVGRAPYKAMCAYIDESAYAFLDQD